MTPNTLAARAAYSRSVVRMNEHQHGHDQYRSQKVGTASPAELIGMLYDGALAAMRLARSSMVDDASSPTAHTQLLKAQAIVTELRCCLNFDLGGEIATNLDRIYEFVGARLVRANVSHQAAAIDEALQALEPIRDAWRQACITNPPAVAGEPEAPTTQPSAAAG